MNKTWVVFFKKYVPYLGTFSRRVAVAYRIIQTVGEHVIAEDALAGGDEGIGVDKSADGGIVITGLQVIEAGILGKGLAKTTFCPCRDSICYPR